MKVVCSVPPPPPQRAKKTGGNPRSWETAVILRTKSGPHTRSVRALAEEVREPYQWHAVGRDHAGLVVNVAQPLVRAGSSLRRGRPRFFTAHIPLPPRHDKIIFFRRPIAPQFTFSC